MNQTAFDFGPCSTPPPKTKAAPQWAAKPATKATTRPVAKRAAPTPDAAKIKELQATIKALRDFAQIRKTMLDGDQRKIAALESHCSSYARQNALLNAMLDEIRKQSASMPPEMLNRLIRLAHPDKHGNSTAANEATAWLLAQRKKR